MRHNQPRSFSVLAATLVVSNAVALAIACSGPKEHPETSPSGIFAPGGGSSTVDATSDTDTLQFASLDPRCQLSDRASGLLGNALRMDSEGNTIVARTFVDEPPRLRVEKLDRSCRRVWHTPDVLVPLAANVQSTFDLDGSLFLAQSSTYREPTIFGSTAESGDVTVGKISPTGTLLWVRVWGVRDPNSFVGPSSMIVDGAGSLFMTGTFRGTVSFDGRTFRGATPSDSPLYLVKLDALGQPVWSHAFARPTNDTVAKILALEVDPTSGDLFLAGGADGSVDFGSGAIAPRGAWVIRIGADGVRRWMRVFADNAENVGLRITPDGNVFVIGGMTGSVDFGDAVRSVSNAGAAGGSYLALLHGSTGATLWSRTFSAVRLRVLAPVGSEHVLIGGETSSAFAGDLGAGERRGTGLLGIYAAKTGQHIWSAGYGGDLGGVYFTGLDALSPTEISMTGGFHDELDFGLGPMRSADRPAYPPSSFVVRLGFVDGHPQYPILDAGPDAGRP